MRETDGYISVHFIFVGFDSTHGYLIPQNHQVTLPLLSEPQSATTYTLSRIPCSWKILHILLCFTGVNNVLFITSLPICLRVASLVYHAAWFCLAVPVAVVYIYNIKWETSIESIVQQVSMIIYGSYMVTLGTAHGINTLKTSRSVKFLAKWCLFCSDEAICVVEEKNKRYKRFRAALVIICIVLILWYVLVVVKSAFAVDWSTCGLSLFPSIIKFPWLLKPMCVTYHILCYLSAFTVMLTASYFAFLTLTFAEEFDKLYRVICIHVSSPSADIGTWEQVRFRHEALVSLVCLHGQMSSMSLGVILVGNIVYLCFSLYYIFTENAGIFGVLPALIAIVVFAIILIPSNMLENEVSKISFNNGANLTIATICRWWLQLHVCDWKMYISMSKFQQSWPLGILLIIWSNFNLRMDK